MFAHVQFINRSYKYRHARSARSGLCKSSLCVIFQCNQAVAVTSSAKPGPSERGDYSWKFCNVSRRFRVGRREIPNRVNKRRRRTTAVIFSARGDRKKRRPPLRCVRPRDSTVPGREILIMLSCNCLNVTVKSDSGEFAKVTSDSLNLDELQNNDGFFRQVYCFQFYYLKLEL